MNRRPGSRPAPAPPSASQLTVISFAVSPALRHDCGLAAEQSRCRYIAATHMQGACAALERSKRALVFVGDALPSWDRHVLEEHTSHEAARLRFLTDEMTMPELLSEIRAWERR